MSASKTILGLSRMWLKMASMASCRERPGLNASDEDERPSPLPKALVRGLLFAPELAMPASRATV
jgi:hypothetical protein